MSIGIGLQPRSQTLSGCSESDSQAVSGCSKSHSQAVTDCAAVSLIPRLYHIMTVLL